MKLSQTIIVNTLAVCGSVNEPAGTEKFNKTRCQKSINLTLMDYQLAKLELETKAT